MSKKQEIKQFIYQINGDTKRMVLLCSMYNKTSNKKIEKIINKTKKKQEIKEGIKKLIYQIKGSIIEIVIFYSMSNKTSNKTPLY